ncbi:hypothetical protein NDU88_003939 [Pleurodeles waltl]|uniref:RING-type domain-containing protein n=1 Tax=Pleurodeles waltl TaxID=8319 RepID=A0AAV7PJL9_PLEWA|nr:hypothetical protein NDU88_003939 [Pleurodeles waltl]
MLGKVLEGCSILPRPHLQPDIQTEHRGEKWRRCPGSPATWLWGLGFLVVGKTSFSIGSGLKKIRPTEMSHQSEGGLGAPVLGSDGEHQDTRCLTCWLTLEGNPQDGHRLQCGHWLCWPCLYLLQASAEEFFGPNICFRCRAPVHIPPKIPSTPPVTGWSRPQLCLMPNQRGSHEEKVPILCSPEKRPEMKKVGTLWKRNVTQDKSARRGVVSVRRARCPSYSKLDESESPPSSPGRPCERVKGVDCHGPRLRLSLQFF